MGERAGARPAAILPGPIPIRASRAGGRNAGRCARSHDRGAVGNTGGVRGEQAGLADAFDEFMTTFETFRETNDQRLAELESKRADVLTVEKVDRISRALDDQKRAIDNLSLKHI